MGGSFGSKIKDTKDNNSDVLYVLYVVYVLATYGFAAISRAGAACSSLQP